MKTLRTSFLSTNSPANAASATLDRANFEDAVDLPGFFWLYSIRMDITSIATATQVSKMTIGLKDEDNSYVVGTSTASFLIDAATATNGTIQQTFDPPVPVQFDGVRRGDATVTGLWLGVQLDAGTANIKAELTIKDHQ